MRLPLLPRSQALLLPQAQARAARVEDATVDAAALEHTMRAVSGLIETMTGLIAEQAEQVTFVLSAAVESRDNIRSGNRELRQAGERRSTLRDFAVAVLLLLAACLLFLDWWSR